MVYIRGVWYVIHTLYFQFSVEYFNVKLMLSFIYFLFIIKLAVGTAFWNFPRSIFTWAVWVGGLVKLEKSPNPTPPHAKSWVWGFFLPSTHPTHHIYNSVHLWRWRIFDIRIFNHRRFDLRIFDHIKCPDEICPFYMKTARRGLVQIMRR